jgi:hypothetical protein
MKSPDSSCILKIDKFGKEPHGAFGRPGVVSEERNAAALFFQARWLPPSCVAAAAEAARRRETSTTIINVTVVIPQRETARHWKSITIITKESVLLLQHLSCCNISFW